MIPETKIAFAKGLLPSVENGTKSHAGLRVYKIYEPIVVTDPDGNVQPYEIEIGRAHV